MAVALHFFFMDGLNKKGPWHTTWHVTLVYYGWEAGYTMYTLCLVRWKKTQKLTVVTVLGNPSCPLPCSPLSSCLSSPSHPSWTWQSHRWQVQLSVFQCRQNFSPGGARTGAPQRGPSTMQERERGDTCLSSALPCPAVLTWGFICQSVFIYSSHQR